MKLRAIASVAGVSLVAPAMAAGFGVGMGEQGTAQAELRGHDAHAFKCLDVPLEDPIALAVAVEFHLHVEAQLIALAEMVSYVDTVQTMSGELYKLCAAPLDMLRGRPVESIRRKPDRSLVLYRPGHAEPTSYQSAAS